MEYERIVLSEKCSEKHCGYSEGFSILLARSAQTFLKRQQDRVSSMVRAAFWYLGKVGIEFPSGRKNAITYKNVYEENLLLFYWINYRIFLDVTTGQCINLHCK